MGRTRPAVRGRGCEFYFNSLAPCGANRYCAGSSGSSSKISTHSPRVGRTNICNFILLYLQKFQLTRPVWGEPPKRRLRKSRARISTHSPRVGRTRIDGNEALKLFISTHSPRVGRTRLWRRDCLDKNNFNSLAPCGANPDFLGIL